MKNNTDNTVKTVSLIMLISLAGKFLAVIRDRALAVSYGTGFETNAFLTASRVPRVFFDAIFASAITASFIPIFNKVLKNEGEKEAFRFSNIFITVVSIIMALLTLIGMVFSKELAYFFADGFDEKTLNLCADLLKVLFPTIIFTGITFAYTGILQSLDSFLVPAMTSVVFNLVIIGYYFTFGKKFGIYGLAFTYLIGWFMQAAIQKPALVKKGYRDRFTPDFKNKYLKNVGKMMLPVMVSTWVQPFNIAIGSKYASRIYEGSGVSAVEFANNLYTMIVGVFILSIMNVVFPRLSKYAAQHQEEKFDISLSNTLRVVMLIVIPLTVGIMVLSDEVIGFIYGGKRFDEFSIRITSDALFYFSLGMTGYSLQQVLSKAYFSREKTSLPMISAAISIVLNVIMCSILLDDFNIKGIAFSASFSASVGALILLVDISKKREIIDRGFFIFLLKIGISSAIMGVVVYVLNYAIFSTKSNFLLLIKLSFLGFIGVIIYFLMCKILRVDEVDKIVSKFIKNRKKSNG